jgi:DNA replication and repair protein RecF
MRLRNLHLEQFRAIRSADFDIDPAGFHLIGPNGSGKSSILESVAMLATTRSPRTSAEREIANWQSGDEFGLPAYARLSSEFERVDGTHRIEIGLAIDNGERGPLKKRIRLDDRAVRAIDAVGELKTVLFSPEDVSLIAGPPAARRRYLDLAISQASRTYLRALSRYARVLEQRNGLLRSFARDPGASRARRPEQELTFWNDELTAAAAEVLAFRLAALEALTERARAHFQSLSGESSLLLVYESQRVDLPTREVPAREWASPPLSYRQELAAAFEEALRASQSEELRRGVTAVGPHRDDFVVLAGSVDLGRFGSRGQQRLAVLSLKVAEVDFLHEAASEAPILLLDDALSELDERHRAKLQSMLVDHNAQLLMTSTEEFDVGTNRNWRLPLWRIESGVPEQISRT